LRPTVAQNHGTSITWTSLPLFLYHHDPEATDEQLNERQFLAQQRFPQTFVAREGLKMPLPSVHTD
jgi:hypothetical protein